MESFLVQLRQLNPNDYKRNEDVEMYLKIYLGSMFGFYIVYLSCHYFMAKVIQFKLYNDLSTYDQADYLSRITAQVHALISSVLSYYLMFYMCGDGKTFFNDDQCYYNATPLAITSLCISFGYISFDLIIIMKDIQDFSSLGMQNVVHHLISMTASLTALFVGGYVINSAVATAFTEVSTIFLHIRYYMIKAKCASGKPFLIVVLIFIGLFIYARLYLQFFVASRMKAGFDQEYDNIYKRQSVVMKMAYAANTMMIFLFCLNIYWLSLLYKGVLRALKSGIEAGGKVGERDMIQKVKKGSKDD